MRKLITLAAAGMLVLAGAPAALAAPGNTTGVTLTVGQGTTIYAPVDFTIGSGFPGETVSHGATVEWLSNETGSNLAVQLGDMTCTALTGACVALGANQTIDNEDFGLAVGAGDEAAFGLDPLTVHSLGPTGSEIEAPDSQAFTVYAHIPSVVNGTYTGTLTFSVQS